jgi:hypothetical protein
VPLLSSPLVQPQFTDMVGLLEAVLYLLAGRRSFRLTFTPRQASQRDYDSKFLYKRKCKKIGGCQKLLRCL